MADPIIEINDDSFEAQVLQSDKPVLVDFWAPVVRPLQGHRTDNR